MATRHAHISLGSAGRGGGGLGGEGRVRVVGGEG